MSDSLRQRFAQSFHFTESAPHDISYHPGRLLLYSPPRQRQIWGESQVLPRVNWGDLFFDLFYVAATYNVSNILSQDPNARGILYSLATFLPCMAFWNERTLYHARFVVIEDDLFHRLLTTIMLVVLAVLVMHIRPIPDMADSLSMFLFTLMLVAERVFHEVWYLEIYFNGIGEPAMKRMAARNIGISLIDLAFYLAATIVSALAVFGSEASRQIAGGMGNHTRIDLPLILVLVGFLSKMIAGNILVIFCLAKDGAHKEHAVPVNVGFFLHRAGEWIMLMLGESVVSLLIVDAPYTTKEETRKFFTSFYCGLLTVVLLQYLHFLSQPRHEDQHAMRRNKNAGIVWNNFQMIYSYALVMLGSCYTIFLTDVATNDTGYGGARLLAFDFEGNRQNVANMFTGTLAVIFFCLDMMIVCHLGFNEGKHRCMCKETGKKNYKGLFIVIFRFCFLAFTVTISQWLTEPTELTIIGLCCVILQIFLRKLGCIFLTNHNAEFRDEQSSGDDSADWPNVTHPRAEAN